MSDGLDDELFGDVGDDAVAKKPEPLFPNVYVFVQKHLVHVIERDVGSRGNRWCRHWFEHAEAVSRLESLWKAFEALRQDPGTGASSWWRDHADPAMAALFDSQGVFRECDLNRHELHEPLPTAEPPEWLIHSGGSGDS